MSDLTDRAIARITEECQKRNYLIPLEEYLTSIMDDSVAEKVLDEKKTLQGCFEKMWDIAKKRPQNGYAYLNCVCISLEEGFSIIQDYYGIDLAEKSSQKESDVIDILDFL